MTRVWSTNVLLLLALLLSISLESNKAAPASKETDSLTAHHNIGDNEMTEKLDEEVLELENLKHPSVHESANTKEEILPQLEKQLEEEAQASVSVTSSDEEGVEDTDEADAGKNNDDDADNEDDDNNNDYADKLAKASESMLLKTLAEFHHKQQQHRDEQQHSLHPFNHIRTAGDSKQTDAMDDNSKLMKLLPGAARLTFGQHFGSGATTLPSILKTTPTSQLEAVPNEETDSNLLTSNGHRRGDNAEVLLRHSGGQYSAFDMAQYVFWTGDEAGVARAVEELIQKGLMTRENAIKFLRDIRLGIDYLQNTYSSRPLKSERHANVHHEHEPATTLATITEATSTLSTNVEAQFNNDETQATLAPEILKVIERLPSLLKLNELSDQTESTQDYDDVVGRLRLADFLYAEYSLEEVIYQLAKVMFTQSLTRGSEPAQHALQKLTEFLESEGNHGRISPVLQKKILDVLLAALADTLAENPDLMKAARSALGKHMEHIPQRFSHEKH